MLTVTAAVRGANVNEQLMLNPKIPIWISNRLKGNSNKIGTGQGWRDKW